MGKRRCEKDEKEKHSGINSNRSSYSGYIVHKLAAILFISVVGTASIFDTGAGTYPSIAGTHTGTIESNQTVTVQKLYTYPCEGTGGHSEHVIIQNKTEKIAEAYWDGYQEDWHNITFSEPFTLIAGETYYYTIRTGSYPLIHHTHTLQTANGWINCTEFVDVNGKSYDNWIPAISLQEQNATPSLTPKFLSNSSYITFYVVGEIENTLPSNIEYVEVVATFYDAQKKEIGSDYTYARVDILKTNQKAPFKLSAFFPEKIYPDSYTLKVSYRETNEEPYTGLKIISHNASINPIWPNWHEIVGEVKNEGTKRVTDVEVVCTYYDAEGKVIGTGSDYFFDSLSAGDAVPFNLWLFPFELRPSSYDLQVQGRVVEDTSDIIEGLTAIRVGGGSWDNWDADMENDGPVIYIVYLDARGDIITDDSTEKMPISADVKLYAGDTYSSKKTKMVFSGHYTEDEIILGSIYPDIRIPKEEISVNPSTDYRYGAVEVTIHTPNQGSFADRYDHIKLYEEY
jgi:hypothetical protein